MPRCRFSRKSASFSMDGNYECQDLSGPGLENSVLSFVGSPCLDVDSVEFVITVISVGTKSSSDIHVFSRRKPSTNQRRFYKASFVPMVNLPWGMRVEVSEVVII